MINIAFVGVAHIHVPGFIRMIKGRNDVKVRSVWDPQRVRAEVRAAELAAQVVDDVNAIWNDSEISAVVVTSETDRHQSLVVAAANAKKHVFAEKPLGMGSQDSNAMADAIERAGVIFQTGYFMRGEPGVQFIKQHIDAGSFGKITRVRGSNCHSGALGNWFADKPNDPANNWRWMANPRVAGVGAFGDLGTHALDLLLWMMGPVTLVTGQLDPVTKTYDHCDETGEALMRFKNGAIGTLAAGWVDVANPVYLIVSGTEGHAALIDGKAHFTSKKVAGYDKTAIVPDDQLPARLPHAFELFLDKLAGKEVPLVSVREAAYRSSVMEAIYDGAARGTWMGPR